VAETTFNTAHAYTKDEALAQILVPNSVLILDSEIMKTDPSFFEEFMDPEMEKRLIIIIHKGGKT
jgi:hypothetical protein